MMKNILLVIFHLIPFSFSQELGDAFAYLDIDLQEEKIEVPAYDVYVVYPALSISKEISDTANTIMDLNRNYKSSWVREYISVEISTSINGELRKSLGDTELLTQEQKSIIHMADLASDIKVKVLYIPENTLKHNDPKEFSFSFVVNPENDASYPGGGEQLKQYIKEHAIDKIPEGSFKNYDMTAVKFAINEEGEVVDAHLFWESDYEKVDALLLDAICNMPKWRPAKFSNGKKIKQEFALTVGNLKNCAFNLLNIRKC